MFIKLLFLIAYFILLFIGVRFLDVFLGFLACSEFKTVGNLLAKYRSCWTLFWGVDNKIQDYDENTNESNFSDNLEEQTCEHTIGKDSLLSYDDLMEKVEDTKASIWVVKVLTVRDTKNFIFPKDWTKLSVRLKKYGIKTAVYDCKLDPRLCISQKIYNPTFLLLTPQGSHPKGNVSFHIFQKDTSPFVDIDHVYSWIQKRLYLRVKQVHSLSELNNQVITRLKNVYTEPSLSFIYQTNQREPPLILSALSVKFTGRIKFYLLKTKDPKKQGNIYAMNKNFKYNYGNHKGESFNYSCIELFLKTLHPEVNDVFVITIVLLNMACWLELFLQKGGPIRRFLYYVWGFIITNIILVFMWLPLIQILCLPQMQPLLRLFLKFLQNVMFTNIAAIIRQDIMHISQHIYIVISGFICYGICLGYLRYKFGETSNELNSFRNVLSNDIAEISEAVNSLILFMTPSLRIYRFEEHIERILNRLTMQDLWLHNDCPNEYIQELPAWVICNCKVEQNVDSNFMTDCSDVSSESEVDDKSCLKEQQNNKPSYMISTDDCVICLRSYKCRDSLMGMSCGHNFHQDCLIAWLVSPNSQRRCPVCRWPADIHKGKSNVIDLVE